MLPYAFPTSAAGYRCCCQWAHLSFTKCHALVQRGAGAGLSTDNVDHVCLQSLAGLEHLELHSNQLGRLDDINSLRKYNSSLRTLNLQGNPVAEEKTYQDLILRRLPHLVHLDGLPVSPGGL